MIEMLVNQINKSLEKGCYITALVSAIIIPDICGKAEFPECESNKSRYIKWYEHNIGQYEKNPDASKEIPYMSGKVIWSLRCKLLHEGNPAIEDEVKDSKDENYTYNYNFELVYDMNNSSLTSCDKASVIECINEKTVKKYHSVSINRLCKVLCSTAKVYFKNNKDKFNFFDYTIKIK